MSLKQPWPVSLKVPHKKQKIIATKDQLWIDCGFYGGLIPDNIQDLESLADAGVLGFKAFLSPSGIDEFPNIFWNTLDESSRISVSIIPYLACSQIQ